MRLSWSSKSGIHPHLCFGYPGRSHCSVLEALWHLDPEARVSTDRPDFGFGITGETVVNLERTN